MAKGLRFRAKMLELIRRHSWTGENRRMLYKSIRLRAHHTVVDVGCGTGAFTRVLAHGLNEKQGGMIVGVDKNPELLRAARRVSREEGFGAIATFKEGNAMAIPLPDNFADRVVCQALLWLMTESDRIKALKEMIRICKKGGLVAAVEGAVYPSVTYFPDNARLTTLYRKRGLAELRGYERIYGYDRNIGFKLPTIFKSLDLMDVRLDGVADVWLQSDDRFPLAYRVEEHKHHFQYPKQMLPKLDRIRSVKRRKSLVEKTAPTLITGGMNWEDVVEFARLSASYHHRMAKDPKAIRGDTSVQAGIAYITTGIKKA